jgi:hypothetical protein
VTRLRFGQSGARLLAGAGKVSIIPYAHNGCGAQPARYLMGTGKLSPWVNGRVRLTAHIAYFTAEVKNKWSCTSTLSSVRSWEGRRYEFCLELYVCGPLVPYRAVLLQLLSVGCQAFRNKNTLGWRVLKNVHRQTDRQTDRQRES